MSESLRTVSLAPPKRFEDRPDGFPAQAWVSRPAAAFSGALFVSILLGSFFVQPSYRASTLIVITDKKIQDEWDLLKDETRDVDFEEQVQSRTVLDPALRKLHLINGAADPQTLVQATERFKKRLRVERIRHSGVLRVSVTAAVPAKAAQEANAVAESFIGYRRARAIARIEGFFPALDEELKEVGEGLRTGMSERNEFLKAHGWNHYETELQTSRRQVATLKTALDSLEAMEHGVGTPADDASLQEVAKQVAIADGALSQAMSRYKEGNPLILQLRRQKQVLQEKLDAQLRERRGALEQLLHREQQRLQGLMAEENKAQALETSITHAQQRYEELLKRRSEAHLSLAQLKQPSDALDGFTILDEALPPPVQSPQIRFVLTLLMGAIVSLTALGVMPIVLNSWKARSWEVHPLSGEEDQVAQRARGSAENGNSGPRS